MKKQNREVLRTLAKANLPSVFTVSGREKESMSYLYSNGYFDCECEPLVGLEETEYRVKNLNDSAFEVLNPKVNWTALSFYVAFSSLL